MPISFYIEMLFVFFERTQKNFDLLRGNILENATSGYQIKGHFFLLAKWLEKLLSLLSLAGFNMSLKMMAKNSRKLEGGALWSLKFHSS